MFEVEYRQWLEKEGYQPNTIATSLASTKSAEKIWSENQIPEILENKLAQFKSVFKRYSRFLHHMPFVRWTPFERFVVDNYEAAKPQLHGNLTKAPLTSQQWQALVTLLRHKADRIDEVLLAMLPYLPAYQPREALSLPLKAFDPSMDVLLAPMRKAKAKYLWEYVSTTPYSAFSRVQTRLRKHSEDLGFEIDFRAIAKTPIHIREW